MAVTPEEVYRALIERERINQSKIAKEFAKKISLDNEYLKIDEKIDKKNEEERVKPKPHI